MTGILAPPEVKRGDRPRTPTIAANLLPVEIVESRRGRKVRWVVLVGLVVFTAVLAGWYGLTIYETSSARTGLGGAQDDVARLHRQQHTYADLLGTQAESAAIGTRLSTLLAGDLPWDRLLLGARTAAPAGVVTGLVSAPTPVTATAGGASASIMPPTGASQRVVGTLTVTGLAASMPAVADYLVELTEVPGLGTPLLGQAIVESDGVRFTVQVDITAAALGGRYPATTGSGSGHR